MTGDPIVGMALKAGKIRYILNQATHFRFSTGCVEFFRDRGGSDSYGT